MQNNFPPRPRGSAILEEHTPNEIVLTLRMPSGRVGRLVSVAFYVFWLCGWIVGGVGVLYALVTDQAHPTQTFWLILWLLLWSLSLIIIVRMCWLLLQRPRSEILTLSADTFRYDPGSSPLTEVYSIGGYWNRSGPQYLFHRFYRELFRKRRPVTATRSQVGYLQLSPSTQNPKIILVVGAQEITIGESLDTPDQKWIFDVLDCWRNGEWM